MTRAFLAWLFVLFVCGSAHAAQETEIVEVRVTSARPGAAQIDRGSADGLAVGDHVQFWPRDGSTYNGVVAILGERSAEIEIADHTHVPAAGTRGDARVPHERFTPQTPPPAEPAPSAAAPLAGAESAQHPPWSNTDPDWKPGDPLLARVRPLRPEERPRSIHGRIYGIVDQIWSTEDDRTDSFFRAGAEVWYENLTGHGDRLQVEGELNYRNTDVPDTDDEMKTRMRLDRLSYSRGGTRFEPMRWEFGRFLQRGMPEFGVLDGVELGMRTGGGDHIGASFGFMPEPNAEMNTGDDLQFATYYRWVRDESEQLSFAAGYQKSFHELAADRDLFVANFRYLPNEGWNVTSTAWIDLYGDTDVAKGAGVELTQMYTSFGRSWRDGSSVSLVYSHLAFPDIERDEFLPVLDTQLADDHNDRLAITSNMYVGDTTHVRAGAGGWVDQEEDGYDAELGLGFDDLVADRSTCEFTGFLTSGRFVSSFGGRFLLSVYGDNSRWSAGYELAQNHFDGFSDDNDDLPQHRVRLGGDWNTVSGWSVSVHGDVSLWDQENAITLGMYLQRSF
jgi:hypothetical protein